jgi:hypothetical protein
MSNHPATPKQTSYIESLLQRRYGSHYITAQVRRDHGLSQRAAKGGMTKAEASSLIDALR